MEIVRRTHVNDYISDDDFILLYHRGSVIEYVCKGSIKTQDKRTKGENPLKVLLLVKRVYLFWHTLFWGKTSYSFMRLRTEICPFE